MFAKKKKNSKLRRKCDNYIDWSNRHSELDLTSKRLLSVIKIKPSWTYRIQLCSCGSKSNIEIVQRCQDIVLHTIVTAYQYDRNDIIHQDMMITSVQDETTKFARKHEKKLGQHTNPGAIRQLSRCVFSLSENNLFN
ncbi:Hypothetical protein CINCED_3A002153 [Cinara cedri]|uniref:Uncharacterized protein n=1 Tax=Cinara cedri TaxID=506608 RepID=A0A5E4M8T5_9HEMI|nr:Hypothetical protein CINCED_3A002153 [Cinara cedri]